MMLKPYKPMLPTLVEEIPTGNDWVYEVKYDGYRCIAYIDESSISLMSRNLRSLNQSFPEIIYEISKKKERLKSMLPLVIDGEIATLVNPVKADFQSIQIRGRTKNESKIKQQIEENPAYFLAFDLLMAEGKEIIQLPYEVRKSELKSVFGMLELPLSVHLDHEPRWQMIQSTSSHEKVWEDVRRNFGEGLIAKKRLSPWIVGSRTNQWLKIKNWIYADFFITGYEKQNGYFHIGLLRDGKVINAGLFIHGLSTTHKEALYQIIKENLIEETKDFLLVEPAICVTLRFIEWYQAQIRHPQFVQFQLEKSWEECTWEAAQPKQGS